MNFRDILNQYGIPIAPNTHEHSRPGWLQIDCPFCSKGWTHYRMGYSLRGNYTNCWACGGHPLYQTVMALTGLSSHEVRKLLTGLTYERPKNEPKPVGTLKLPQGIGPLRPTHCKYLASRGFCVEQLKKLWDLQGIGIHDKLPWSIFIPFYYHGEVVSWLSRKITNGGQRYHSAGLMGEKLRHKDLLYGEDYCRNSIIVVEGPTDVWTIGPGAVATCGVGVSPSQISRIANYSRRIICFDNEPAAQRRARKVCDTLECLPGETFNVVLKGKDANSSKRREVDMLRSMLV